MRLNSKNKKNKFFSLLLVFIIFISNVFNFSTVKADDGDWGVLPNDSDKRFTDTTITWSQIHYMGDDTRIRYYTYKYAVSKEPYVINIPFNEGSNASIEHYLISVVQTPDDYTDSSHQKILYTVQRQDIMNAADKLGVTPEDILNGTGKVYLNPVYRTYLGAYNEANVIDDWIFGLTAMKAAAPWSQQTLNDLPSFYNINLTFTRQNIYNVQVKPVDKNMNSLSGAKNQGGTTVGETFNLSDNKKILTYLSSYTYSLAETNQILKKNNVTYTYSHWDYEYDKRADGSSALTRISNNSTLPVSFKGPDAQGDTTLTIYIVYEPEVPNDFNLEVWAVDKNKVDLRKLKGPESQKGNNPYSYQEASSLSINNVTYNYQNSAYIEYTKDNASYSQPLANLNPARITLPNADMGSTVKLKLVYDKGPVITPTITPTPTPVPTNSPTPTPALPAITPPPSVPPASLPFTTVVNAGVLRADVRGSEKFVATLGVPTTESLYAEVTAKKYLLGYTFVKKVGIEDFTVKVTRNYILQWYSATPTSAGGGKLQTEKVPVTQIITVPRAYGYWEITNLECYKISSAVIQNYALPNGSITIIPNYSYYSPPTVSVSHSADPKYHIIPPDAAVNGITLPDVIITPPAGQEIHKPSIPQEDFTYTALSQTGKAKVKSDGLIFNGSIVISDTMTETDAPNINTAAIPQCYDDISNNVLYKPDNVIAATKLNGEYPTMGTITYTAVAQIGSYKSNNLQYSIGGLNNVVIHTPVVCIPSIIADNDKYVQLINPQKDCVELVLDSDPNLSDFTVHISNTGFHSGKQGYFTRDFSKSLRNPSISYIASENGLLKNQVKFPFDVYIDLGKANDCSDDDFIKAGIWITIDRSTPRFYLPMTVHEGVYSVDFRTIAVNGEPFLDKTEDYANTQLYNYVATDKLKVEISGRIYGLTVYDISDYPMWEDAFRVPNSLDFKKDSPNYPDGTSLTTYSSGRSYTYTLGTNDQYGKDNGRNNKYTFPLVNGSHPQYNNQGILKTGYLFRFMLETTGNMFSDSCKISIKPNFYYVDKDGKNRVAVDLYYTESFNNKSNHLVKIGSPLDQTNLKDVRTGDIYLGIPEKELKQTAALRGMNFSEFTTKYSTMFNFSDIRLNWAFRTYTNNAYLSKVKSYASYSDVTAKGITDGDILQRMQRWYGQYYVPNEVHVVKKGYDVMDYADKYGVDYNEAFWLKDGYIIVNFTIETVGEDGNHRLSYINSTNYKDNGNCSMWLFEGPVITKTSNKGPTFNFYAGDIMIYYTNKRMSDDYETGAIY